MIPRPRPIETLNNAVRKAQLAARVLDLRPDLSRKIQLFSIAELLALIREHSPVTTP